MRRRERAAQWHLLFLAVVVLGPLVIYPLVRLVLLSLTGPHGGLGFQAYATFFGNPETRGVVGTTLWILFASAGLASLLGVALASMLFFKPFPGCAARHAFPRTVRRVSVVSGRLYADLSVRLAGLGQYWLAAAVPSAVRRRSTSCSAWAG